MKLKILIGALVFLIVVNLATLGSYIYFRIQHTPPPLIERFPPFGGGPPHWEGHSDVRLDLTPEQRRQLQSLIREFQEESRELRFKKMGDEERLMELLQADTLDTNVIEQTIQQISEEQFEIRRIAIRKLVKARTFLTPNQQKRFYLSLIRGRGAFRGSHAPHPEMPTPHPGNGSKRPFKH